MADILIFGIIGVGLVLSLVHIRKQKKSGGGCAGCSGCGSMNDNLTCDMYKEINK